MKVYNFRRLCSKTCSDVDWTTARNGLTQAIAGFALCPLYRRAACDWTLPGTWAWIALFLYIAASGAALLGYARSP